MSRSRWCSSPVADRVLAVVAHPDDEVLGCGGTLARHAAAGEIVHILILAEGSTSRQGAPDDGVRELHSCARDAAAHLGATEPRFAGFPDQRMDSVPLLDIVKAVEDVVAEISPTIVYTHHGGDLNLDHRLTNDAVLAACRPLPGSTVRAVYAFETPSSTEWAGEPAVVFRPNRFHDISAHLDAKLEALRCYGQELRDWPHPRSIEAVSALARWRGATVAVEAAEAFCSLRERW